MTERLAAELEAELYRSKETTLKYIRKYEELEMHRSSYQMFKDAGWESPEECLSAFGTMEARLASQERALEVAVKALEDARVAVNAMIEEEAPRFSLKGLRAGLKQALNQVEGEGEQRG